MYIRQNINSKIVAYSKTLLLKNLKIRARAHFKRGMLCL